ncbi:MAG TPA: TrkH family potassium uptake protein [Micavibrio sp.]|nr:TrkH family potassium uptake protein [Micavibrio sp.]HIL28858.1 TrkH family potassium uptake protein [Micavibrio sp.]
MDLRPILYVIGILLSTLALSMSLPMLVDIYYGSNDWKVFFLCIMTTAFFGGALVLSNSGGEMFSISIKQAFVLTTVSWLVLATFAALPLWFSELGLSFTDAFFEAMSGITTTGSTILTHIEGAPRGILIWRAILQWLGGIGIIVMALSVLPFLKVGGMQLFRTESSENEKVLPRAAKLASSIGYIYLLLTVICAACYHMTGLPLFDAVAHAMTTIATGGFSTFDTSFGNFDTPHTEMVAIVFMLMGGLPFVLYLKALRGDWRALFKDSQVRWFLGIISAATFVLVSYLVFENNLHIGEALRRASFNVISVITGTGYASSDYGAWGGFAVGLLFFVMVIGGCAGSTSCGIKVFRFQVLYAVTNVQMKKLLHPNGVFIPYYGGKPLPEGVPSSVMSFFFLFALCFSFLAIALSYIGLDFLTAMSGAATSIANVGPGLGSIIGPTGTFAPLPDSAKWLLCFGMLLGRLELFTVLVLLAPQFWRR